MTHKAAFAAVLLTAASPALAQGVTGGQLGIDYNVPLDGSDFGDVSYSGGLEYGFAPFASASINARGVNSDNADDTGTNVTLHGTYHLNDLTSFGLFVARDGVDDFEATLVGLEGGADLLDGKVGGYLGTVTGDADGTIVGVDGGYGITPAISAIGNVDYADTDDAEFGQIAIGAEYRMLRGPSVYAKLGQASRDTAAGDDSYGFVSLGVEVAFGAARGTTFDTRSLLDVVPGF
ncbi:hypothetical protein EU805_09215 [Salipiger sp. IMCC34102]|uniref:hypothetical protein n=1 Tax=Salipiger sp. IMCC34102 TaxID=2510647 RepID=UPI00101C856A|nr:hypothetical protein [Salipiger sp. IMCC34102]RYH02771.1 hypothetical protein EU805_09215 [Salipiger sp. IMCC34102]